MINLIYSVFSTEQFWLERLFGAYCLPKLPFGVPPWQVWKNPSLDKAQPSMHQGGWKFAGHFYNMFHSFIFPIVMSHPQLYVLLFMVMWNRVNSVPKDSALWDACFPNPNSLVWLRVFLANESLTSLAESGNIVI